MITIDLKETHRTGTIHASGTIGGLWIFRHGIEELLSIRVNYSWVASFCGWWRATFPGGLNRDGTDSIKIMGRVNTELMRVYPEG